MLLVIHSEDVRLNQVTIGSVDLVKSEQFYSTLGLRLIVKNEHYLRFECPDGGSTFSIDRVDAPSPDEHVTIYFESDDLDGVCDHLAAEGVRLDQPPQEMPWLWREARLTDPDGHRLCLFSAGENRRNPPWRIPDPPSEL